MRYLARTWQEEGSTIVEFPDCEGCVTQADPGQDVAAVAGEALESWIEAELVTGQIPPRPSERLRRRSGCAVLGVDVPPRLAVKLALRWARQARGLTQVQLARLAGVAQPSLARVESPGSNPTVATLEKIAAALGCRLEVALAPMPLRAPVPSPAALRSRPRRSRRGTARAATA